MSAPEIDPAAVLKQLAGFEQLYATNMQQLLQTLRQIDANFQKLRIQHYETKEDTKRVMAALRARIRELSPKKPAKKKATKRRRK